MSADLPRSEIVGEQDAAKYLDVSVHYLRVARLNNPRGEGPPFLRFGRLVKYRIRDLDAWASRRRVTRRAK